MSNNQASVNGETLSHNTIRPSQLEENLEKIIDHNIMLSVMIWGAPGIGKSSIVAQAAADHEMSLIDVRLSQLAPTDLRGLPVPDHESKISRWYPPSFLPTSGSGILFLDEINMAAPAIQGIAQQLILDRRVGDYKVPDSWFVWAAGNRKEDRASVSEMPAPLANRFLHYFVGPDLDSWKSYAFSQQIPEEIISFVTFRSDMLHRFDQKSQAWPSPRSWFAAAQLHKAGLPIGSAVSEPVATEFESFLFVRKELPDLDLIARGQARNLQFPRELSVRYATVVGLVSRVLSNHKHAENCMNWLFDVNAGPEFIQMFVSDLFGSVAKISKEELHSLVSIFAINPKMRQFLIQYSEILGAVNQ